MTVKKILSVVLSALVLMASMFTVGAAAAPTIVVTGSGYDVVVTVTSDVSGTMTAQLVNAANDKLYGMEAEDTPVPDLTGKFTYTFNFRMGNTTPAGTYTVRVGNNVPKTEQNFSYPFVVSGPVGGPGGGSGPIDKPTNPDKVPGSLPTQPTGPVFNDLSQAEWAKEAIQHLAAKGIVAGKSTAKFCPNDYVTREEGAKIITGAFDFVNKSASSNFTDVANNRWSYMYVSSASSLGIINGDGTSFRPTATMTREEMATILHRVYVLLDVKISGGAMKFNDDNKVSSWAKEAVSALSGAGVINGMGDGSFAPKSPVTRAQLAKVVYEILKLMGGA